MNTTTPIKILLVEDQVELAELLRDYLLNEDYEVEVRHTGHRIIEQVRNAEPDMLLLDLMLPGTDGMTICRSIRRFSDVPIIMVTARTEEIDRLLGLEIGADDYICKPVRPREVVARVKAVLRRTLRQPDELASEKSLTIDEARYLAFYDGQPLDLTPLEFRLLQRLAHAPGRVYSRDQLLQTIHDDERIVSDRAIDTHIKNLRKKLAALVPGEDNPIRSIYGVGYKLELP